MLPFKVIYHPQYDLDLGTHVFPSEKFRLIRDALLDLPELQMAGTVAAYYSVGAEPDTRGLVYALWKRGNETFINRGPERGGLLPYTASPYKHELLLVARRRLPRAYHTPITGSRLSVTRSGAPRSRNQGFRHAIKAPQSRSRLPGHSLAARDPRMHGEPAK